MGSKISLTLLALSVLSFILAIAAPELSKFTQWSLLRSESHPGQKKVQHAHHYIGHPVLNMGQNSRPQICYVLLTRIMSYYLLFSDPLILPKKGASKSMGKGNRITLLLSVAMPDNVCK